MILIPTVLFVGLSVFGNKKPEEPDEKAQAAEVAQKPQLTFPVHIHKPQGPLLSDVGQKDSFGKPILVRCMTCHALREPDKNIQSAAALKTFHNGLAYSHGKMSCLSCHNGGDYDTFRLADGTSVERPHVMKLCAQCHGSQMRDYENGAHGGMTGYWDLSKGPRERNHCLDCHDPHAPAYPLVQPVFRPKDRFPPVPAHGHE